MPIHLRGCPRTHGSGDEVADGIESVAWVARQPASQVVIRCKRPSGDPKFPGMVAVLTHSFYEHLATLALLSDELGDGLDQLG